MSELRPHSRQLLDAARLERTPSREDRERVLRALTTGAALSGVAAAAATPSLFAKLGGGLGKWWLIGGMSSALVGGGYFAATHEDPPPQGASSSAVRQSIPPEPLLTTPAPLLPPATVGDSDAPHVRPSFSPPSAAVTGAPNASASPLPAVASKRENARPSLSQELEQLHAAHAAYRSGQAGRALGLLGEHRKQFPSSQLRGERAVLEVLVLCRMGRTAQAQQLAAKLRQAAPGSATLAGLEGSCAATGAK